jgi:hypothetical protein
MLKHPHDVGHGGAPIFNLRCPFCRRLGAFPGAAQVVDLNWRTPEVRDDGQKLLAAWHAGVRVCPNPECRGVVFLLRRDNEHWIYPPELREFDPSDIPVTVRECMEEAIKCHAQECYRASAIMVRRTLEALCEDRGVSGPTLERRIEGLRTQIVISQDLIDGAHEIRFLGNDAAHIEAKVFMSVGKAEVEAAIDLAKELLRATYPRLRALKSST